MELQVTSHVIVSQQTWLVYWTVGWVNPSGLSTTGFICSNESNDNRPESVWNLGDVSDGWSRDTGVEEEGTSFNLFSNEESNIGKHGNTFMGELGLTVSLE
eukprot:1079496_1